MSNNFDVAVIGAGVFGAWTAHFLQRAGQRVLLLDAYGPANNRASSGGESRIIRMAYGPDDIYTQWSMRSLPEWEALDARSGAHIFHRTGVLWIARENDPAAEAPATLAAYRKHGVAHESLSEADLRRRYPQFAIEPGMIGYLETRSGTIMARRAVEAIVREAVQQGVEYRNERVEAPAGNGRLPAIGTGSGAEYSAGQYVFACGTWLPYIFPDLLGEKIFPTRQEVFFFGVPPGDARFSPPQFPTFIDRVGEYYGMGNLESRGVKVGGDFHGGRINPDTMERMPTPETLAIVRAYVARRFPLLKDAPVTEARVCQYENTSSGDFLIDRHPGFENVWIAGGGSGHGFKHGPALGEYVAERVTKGSAVEKRFSLATKSTVQNRAVH
jgi:monomeric sarcosine oxidase